MKDSPVGWAMLMYDLENARDDLDALMSQMQNDPDFGEECFRIRMSHIYWHLNRAWRRRNVAEDFPEDEEVNAGRLPDDLEPL